MASGRTPLAIDGLALSGAGTKSTSLPEPSVTYELNELKRKLERRENELKRKEKELGVAQKEIARLNKDAKVSQIEIQSLRERNEQLQQALINSKLVTQNAIDEADIHLLNAKVKDLQEALEKAVLRYNSAETDLRSVLASEREAKIQCETYCKQLSDFQAKDELARKEIEELGASLKRVEAENLKMKSELAQTRADIDSFHCASMSAKKEIDKLRALISEKDAQLLELKESNKKLQSTLNVRNETNALLRLQMEEINSSKFVLTKDEFDRFKQLEVDQVGLKAQLADLLKAEEINIAAIHKLKEVEAKSQLRFEESAKGMASLNAQLEQMKKLLTTETNELKNAKKENARLTKDNRELSSSLRALKTEKAANGGSFAAGPSAAPGMASTAATSLGGPAGAMNNTFSSTSAQSVSSNQVQGPSVKVRIEELEAKGMEDRKKRKIAEESVRALRNRISFLLDQLEETSTLASSWHEQKRMLLTEIKALHDLNLDLRSRLLGVHVDCIRQFEDAPVPGAGLGAGTLSPALGGALNLQGPGGAHGPIMAATSPSLHTSGADGGVFLTDLALSHSYSSPSPLIGIAAQNRDRVALASPSLLQTSITSLASLADPFPLLQGAATGAGMGAGSGAGAGSGGGLPGIVLPTTPESTIERSLFDLVCAFSSGSRSDSKKSQQQQHPSSAHVSNGAGQKTSRKVSGSLSSKSHAAHHGEFRVAQDDNGLYEIQFQDADDSAARRPARIEANELLSSLQMPTFLKFVQARQGQKATALFVEKIANILNFTRSLLADQAAQLAEGRVKMARQSAGMLEAQDKVGRIRHTYSRERSSKQKIVMKFTRELMRFSDLQALFNDFSQEASDLQTKCEINFEANQTRLLHFLQRFSVKTASALSQLEVNPGALPEASPGAIEIKLPDSQIDDETLHGLLGLLCGVWVNEVTGKLMDTSATEDLNSMNLSAAQLGLMPPAESTLMNAVNQAMSSSGAGATTTPVYLQRLQAIVLKGNNLTDLSCKLIGSIIERSVNLRIVDLRENYISPKGALVLMESARKNPSILFVTQKQGGTIIEAHREVIDRSSEARSAREAQFSLRIDLRHNDSRDILSEQLQSIAFNPAMGLESQAKDPSMAQAAQEYSAADALARKMRPHSAALTHSKSLKKMGEPMRFEGRTEMAGTGSRPRPYSASHAASSALRDNRGGSSRPSSSLVYGRGRRGSGAPDNSDFYSSMGEEEDETSDYPNSDLRQHYRRRASRTRGGYPEGSGASLAQRAQSRQQPDQYVLSNDLSGRRWRRGSGAGSGVGSGAEVGISAGIGGAGGVSGGEDLSFVRRKKKKSFAASNEEREPPPMDLRFAAGDSLFGKDDGPRRLSDKFKEGLDKMSVKERILKRTKLIYNNSMYLSGDEDESQMMLLRTKAALNQMASGAPSTMSSAKKKMISNKLILRDHFRSQNAESELETGRRLSTGQSLFEAAHATSSILEPGRMLRSRSVNESSGFAAAPGIRQHAAQGATSTAALLNAERTTYVPKSNSVAAASAAGTQPTSLGGRARSAERSRRPISATSTNSVGSTKTAPVGPRAELLKGTASGRSASPAKSLFADLQRLNPSVLF